MKRLITIMIAATLLSGCATTYTNTADVQSRGEKTVLFVNMPYQRSVDAVKSYVFKCWKQDEGGVIGRKAFEAIDIYGMNFRNVYAENDGYVSVEYTKRGEVLWRTEIHPTADGTNVVTYGKGAGTYLSKTYRDVILAGGNLSCWNGG